MGDERAALESTLGAIDRILSVMKVERDQLAALADRLGAAAVQEEPPAMDHFGWTGKRDDATYRSGAVQEEPDRPRSDRDYRRGTEVLIDTPVRGSGPMKIEAPEAFWPAASGEEP